jgi:hypothetical protein
MRTERFFADLHAAYARLAGDSAGWRAGYPGGGVRRSARKASALG